LLLRVYYVVPVSLTDHSITLNVMGSKSVLSKLVKTEVIGKKKKNCAGAYRK